MSDRFEDLRTFVTVVQGQGFNAAAERLGLVKSAVSRRIRDLEERLGVRLINRTTRRLSLTDTGQELYFRALKILADLDEAEGFATTGAQEASGRLRITAPATFSIHCLAPMLGEFMLRHPNLSIDLQVEDRIVDIVAEGYDLAIRISQLKDSTLIARQVASVRHVCVASPAYLAAHGRPQTPQDLRAHRGIAYSNVEDSHYWRFGSGEVGEPQTALAMDNGDAIAEAAISGYGVAYLPTFIVHRAIEAGSLEIILADFMRPPIGMYAVFPSARNVPAKVRLFIDFAVETFGGKPYWDQVIFPDA